MKKIISTALLLVMLFSAVSVLFTPITAKAANSPSSNVTESTMALDDIKAYIADEYLSYKFQTSEEMLNYELEKGYLDSCTTADGKFTIYVNRYSGFLYYRNNVTGQILTSNPTDPGYKLDEGASNTDYAREFMGQISVELTEISNISSVYRYQSVQWAAQRGQISVSAIDGGLRVNYILGDTSTRFLLPGAAPAKDFTEDILVPMLEKLEEEYREYADNNGVDFVAFFGNRLYDRIEEDGYIATKRLENYLAKVDENVSNTAFYNAHIKAVKAMTAAYVLLDPADESTDYVNKMAETYPCLLNGEPIYHYYDHNVDNAKKREHERYIKTLCPDYTMNNMFDDEKEVGYVHVKEQKLVVRCALEYTFNDDGTLNIRLPSSSITFDESVYTLKTITPLQYFGYGNMAEDGFIFFPDGSGTVVEFDDFYDADSTRKVALSVSSSVYGTDYCYSKLTGFHREQITMPVYGLVNDYKINATTASVMTAAGQAAPETIKMGYFSILEEGSSLASLGFSSGGATHKYGSAFATYAPYPSDQYDLSQTLSVGSASSYTIVAESRYTGSYITRVTMLTDDRLGTALYGAGNYYNTSYVGMANYYRNYLKADGTLDAIELVSEDLPLYIEALGSMIITEKILTFPVEKSIPLTAFDDVLEMYKQISNAKAHIEGLIENCKKTAEEQAAEYLEDEKTELAEQTLASAEKKVAEYELLLTKIDAEMTNINFKLTGFANDGMYFTYPSKIKWERALGGKKDFKNLVAESNKISETDGVNFSIFPEFDFLYVTNTAAFDGISKSKHLSRMVDNRYASKQVYNEVLQSYETFFTMVVSSDALDDLYTDFSKDYKKYDINTLSVSTLGSDINSNFDKDNSINRDQSRENVIALLDRMANKDKYNLMMDKGNIYAVKYASHILNVAIDSSNFQLSSYSIPFVGMILHGHVSYAGTPMNYSGSIDYEIIRSIESGAAPYFILCYQNTAHMKDDETLNKYYGVNYEAWYADMLTAYNVLNTEIGSLQDYEISNHVAVLAERAKDEDEMISNYTHLEDEFIAIIVEELDAKLRAKFDELSAAQDYTTRVNVTFDVDAITAQFAAIIADAELAFNADTFAAKLTKVVSEFTAEYPTVQGATHATVNLAGIDNYTSQYHYYTNSDCYAGDDYVRTDYTIDNGKVVVVTYTKGTESVSFLLNFNIYTVQVNVGGKVVTLDKYGFQNLNELEGN